ncbi:INO80 complex subunit D-like protein [Tanacetum coccineum]
MSSPPPPHHLPLAAVTSPEDLHLSTATHLHRQQILRRRSHNMKELSKCYRDHYWGLIEEIRVRYREYMWQHGISPVNEVVVGEGDGVVVVKEEGDGEGGKDGREGKEGGKCAFNACAVKAMTLTRFCRSHILSDAKQQLYKPCEFSLKRVYESSIAGFLVIRSYSWRWKSMLKFGVWRGLYSRVFFGADIYRLGECLTGSKKTLNGKSLSVYLAGLFKAYTMWEASATLSRTLSLQHALHESSAARCSCLEESRSKHYLIANKFAPKLHVIVTEYVREIKERRKNALRANQDDVRA